MENTCWGWTGQTALKKGERERDRERHTHTEKQEETETTSQNHACSASGKEELRKEGPGNGLILFMNDLNVGVTGIKSTDGDTFVGNGRDRFNSGITGTLQLPPGKGGP